MNTAFIYFRKVAFWEGCSYLALFITMVLKYKYAMPKPNYVVGLAHGALFIAYMLLLLQVCVAHKWSLKKILLSGIAAFIPFGTFYAAKKIYPAP